jgi:hypothetical protein
MTALGRVHRQMQNDAICAPQKVIAEEPPTAQSGGSRVRHSKIMLTKRYRPRLGGRNSRIPVSGTLREAQVRPALLRAGGRYKLPASGGRVAAGEHFTVKSGREPR